MAEIYTYTPISVAEKIFKVSFREAMSVCSWSNFLCGKRFFIGDRVGTTLSYECLFYEWREKTLCSLVLRMMMAQICEYNYSKG